MFLPPAKDRPSPNQAVFQHRTPSFFEDNDGSKLLPASLFPIRFGLRVYAINTRKALTWNAFAAAHFNANFGEDDHSRVNMGFLRYFGTEYDPTR